MLESSKIKISRTLVREEIISSHAAKNNSSSFHLQFPNQLETKMISKNHPQNSEIMKIERKNEKPQQFVLLT
jgi:hypothetical protein